MSPKPLPWLMPALVVVIALATLALERLIPFEPAWNAAGMDWGDAGYLALTSVTVRIAEALVWTLIVMWLGAAVPREGSLWPSDWPIVAQVFLAFAVGDLLPYLYHRASHESNGFLWRVHAIHHAPERLYTLNFARFHPLNAFLTAALTLLPLALLGVPEPVLFVAAVLHNVHGVLSHSNVDFKLGPLNWIFSMAELHRWHHSRNPALANGNYGATVLVWDWVFRTRKHPASRVGAEDVGLWTGSSVSEGIRSQLLYPFGPALRTATRMWRAARRRSWCCAAS